MRKQSSSLILLLGLFAASIQSFASRKLADEFGRVVELPDHPHRIICLTPNVTDDVYALGAGDDVVAVSDYSKYPPEAEQKPSIGLPLSPSLETIVSLHPDLILASGDTNREETVRDLDALGLPVFLINPRGLQGILHSVRILGKALNREAAADGLANRLQARLEAVESRVRDKAAVRIFMPIWYDPVITIGKHAFITEIIAAAGGRSVTDDISEEWPQVGLETIIARAPEALLWKRDSKMSVDDLASRAGWNNLPAVRNRKLYYVDDRIELPSAVAFDALEDLAKQLHP